MSTDRHVGQRRIAQAGAAYASEKHLESKISLEEMMGKIEGEIDANDGIYPYNDGKLTVDELLRRAGKSPAYLQKKTPKIEALKNEVNAWIRRVKGQIGSGAPSVRREVNSRVKVANKQLDEIRQNYHEAELQLTRVTAELADATRKIGELEKRNTELLKQLAGKTVVSLKPEQRK
ncbi:DNA repair exonuclease SbcCD ATPase subunit [Bradyrhizobium sp. USDA 4474]